MKGLNRNAGLTLIEYVVAFAVLSIAVLGIWSFYITATKTSTGVNKNAELYNEAQLTINQLERIVVNANLGVNFEDEVLTLYDISYDDNGNQKGIKVEFIKCEENKLYYNDAEVLLEEITDDMTLNGVSPTEEWQLMAEGVTYFNVVFEEENHRILTDITFEKGRYSYKVEANPISFRNDVVEVDAETTVGELKETISSIAVGEVTGVVISITPSVAGASSSVQLEWTVTGNNVAQEIDKWIVATDENMEYILDSAIAKVDGDGNVILDFAEGSIPKAVYFQAFVAGVDGEDIASNVVQLRLVQGIELSTAGATGSSIGVGETVQMRADVTGEEMTPMEKMVTWSVEPVDEGVDVEISSNGLLKVNAGSSWGNFYVIARLKSYPTVGVKCLMKVGGENQLSGYLDIKTPVISSSGVTEYQRMINRGGTAKMSVYFNGDLIDPSQCDWSVKIRRTAYSSEDYVANDSVKVGTSGVLSVKESLNFSESYEVLVTAKLKKSPNVKGEVRMNVPSVGIVFSTANELQPGKTQEALACLVDGLENYEIEWTMWLPNYNKNGDYEFVKGNGDAQIVGKRNAEGFDVAYVTIGTGYGWTEYTVRATVKGYPNIYRDYHIPAKSY